MHVHQLEKQAFAGEPQHKNLFSADQHDEQQRSELFPDRHTGDHELSDRQLFETFRNYGQQALEARNKCIGLLPEIFRRQIYLRHGHESIYEFAAKLAGLSHEQVNRVLNLEPRLEDKPALHKALVTGEVSINKLRRVISIATVENQAELAKTIKTLSVRAVECLVKDQKILRANGIQLENAADTNTIDQHGHVPTQKAMFSDGLQLEAEVRDELLEMQRKGLDINKLLKKFLAQHKEDIVTVKKQIAENLPSKASRYVPVKVRAILGQEFGHGCSIPGCQRPAETLHHTRRFALISNHDPRFMAPLCAGHHQLAHQVDYRVNNRRLAAGIVK
jgi:hypothetical protein